MKILYIFAATLVIVSIGAASGGPLRHKVEPSKAEQRIFELINQEREWAGLSKLEWNDDAAQAARAHSQLQAIRNELSHKFRSEPGLQERLGVTGLRFTVSAENIAHADSPEETHAALMLSHGHRANIMNPHYNSVGIGVVENSGRLWVTEDFAYTTAVYSEDQFLEVFVQTFNRARKKKGIPAIGAEPDAYLHNVACSTKGNVQNVTDGLARASEAVLFTASEPTWLPDQLNNQVEAPYLTKVRIGVCYRPDLVHGYANFWVAAVFHQGR